MGCPFSSRRSRTSSSQDPTRARKESEPWWHMAKTYAWVMEQEIADMTRKNEETVQWIRRQQDRDRRERTMFPTLNGYYARMMDELDEAEDRHRQIREEQLRRQGAPLHRGADHAVQEELRRLQARRKQTERCRAAYSRRKALEEERERERLKRETSKAQRAESERSRWREYEDRWNHITVGAGISEHLTFQAMPWPMFSSPRALDDIRPAEIAMFLLSSQHSHDQSVKDRVRSALRRWHPDRFGRLLDRVREEDKASVAEGAGVVARCLSNLLERSG